MKEKYRQVVFESPLGKHIENLIASRRAVGYKYDATEMAYGCLDRFLSRSGLREVRLPKELALKWMERRPNEKGTTQLKRISDLRRLGLYLVSHGVEAYVVDPRLFPRMIDTFRPRILTREEMKRFWAVADSMQPSPVSPLLPIVMPLIFRVLYSCGLRLSEALKLKMKDVDCRKGVLAIRQAKFMKDRLVPLDPGLWRKIERYTLVHRCNAGSEDFLFPSPWGGHYYNGTVRRIWQILLYKSSIQYEGKDKGPRIHDLRHTFAVHRLTSWHAAGEDLSVMLPILSTYLGHKGMSGTQRYLHMTAEMYSEMTGRLERDHGLAIPGRARP